MAVHQKYEQAVVVQDIADSMMHGEFNHEEHQALFWQLVVDTFPQLTAGTFNNNFFASNKQIFDIIKNDF